MTFGVNTLHGGGLWNFFNSVHYVIEARCEHTVVVISGTRFVSFTVPRRCRPPTFSASSCEEIE